ncbi:hypothetical protein AALP_AA4G073500 [Arabis alpina]|uniref:Uncharacterized protein n=1 Tax=Arabis alpina TaxID=50452 RepID=A0A087H1R7_ARAAL|nr:hypothetical protein AALP_AA4G073500 [Arabis alpina]
MGKKRSFRELASGSAGASEAAASPSTTSAPKTVPTPSTAPALAPSTTSVPSSTHVPSTTSTSKPRALLFPWPLLAPGKMQGRRPKRRRTRPRRVITGGASLELVFDDDAAAARLFATMVFPDVPYTRVRASSSWTMSRARLKAKIEKQKRRADNYAKGELATKTERNKYAEHLDKRNNELERALGDNKRLCVENEKLAKKLETAKQDASNSLTFLTRRNEQVDELKKQVEQKRKLLKTAKALIVDLHEKFAIAKAKFVELKGDPQDKMIYQVQREANLDFGIFFCNLHLWNGSSFAKPTLPNQDKPLKKLAAEAGVEDVSGSLMSLENAGELLQGMRIDSAGLLKNLMISVDGRMSFAGENEAEVTMTAVADPEAEKTRIGGEAAEIEKAVADEDGAERAVSEKVGLTTLVTSTEVVKDAEVHP